LFDFDTNIAMLDEIQVSEKQMTCRQKPLSGSSTKGNIMSTITSSSVLSTTTAAELAQAMPSPVVINDTPAAAIPAQGLKATYAAIEQLVVEHDAWKETAFRTSNEQLYVLLQKCYGIYKAMEGTSPEAVALRNGLRDYISLKGHSFTKTTHTLTKIVKCVFGTDRRRVSAYSIVLRSALAQRVGILDVAQFIRDAGGVEEIRLAKSPNAMSPKQKAQIANSTVVVNNMGVISSPALSGLMNDVGKIGSNMVLIGTWQSDGSVVVRAVVESDTVLTAALASHYSAIKEAAKTQAIEQKAAVETATTQQAIEAAAATATVTM
jgi:hypothetical protein